jgi:DNA-binding NtrC family response regulator
MPIEKIIVLEDDLIVRKNLEQQLRQRRYDVAAVSTVAETQDLLARDNFDLIFLDVRLPDGECMRDGAFDYLIKPFSTEQIDIVLKKAEAFTRILKVNQFLSQEEAAAGSDLLGRSPVMENLRQLIRKVGRTQATVLIQGESGTGKELVARALYLESPRADAPFIKINCAAIPENLIESEFFGHEKGSFTGALTKREGRFELAHGGTILLDEISEISPTVQAKLLRVLQEREFERVGGSRTIKVDVRVIATTNRQLEQSVDKKEFRQDLYFRLNVVPIHVPPLRDRREDIPHLVESFVQRFARKHGVGARSISPECMSILRQHSWPGNVRELQNVIERAVILSADSPVLDPEHLGLALPVHQEPSAPLLAPLPLPNHATALPTVAPSGGTPATRPGQEFPNLAEWEQQHILAALLKTGNNRTQAARLLGISIRTLRNKLQEYKLQNSAPEASEEVDGAE